MRAPQPAAALAVVVSALLTPVPLPFLADNEQSLEVSYLHLSSFEPILAIWVADAPAQMLPLFHEAARAEVLTRFGAYEAIHRDVFVRITDLPISDAIRDIRQSHLNALIKISGVVTRRTGVFPQLQSVKYDCIKCGFIIGPLVQNAEAEIKLSSCPQCQSKGPFSVNVEQTLYRNYQKMTLQESPGSVPAGRLPRSKDVVLLHDLIDCARPGEEVEVTGVYTNNFDMSLNTSGGFPVFATVVEANYVRRNGAGGGAARLSDDDRSKVLELAARPRIARMIAASIAPSIHGHEDIKLALALALFGGQEKHVKGKARLRGDINVLLLGDPGTAKSQFLKYVEKTAHRAVYTTGKGASAVGLTAAVHKDPVTREGMPVAVRHIESMIRMSEAHAAMHLREQVMDADVDAAISVMIKSFVATQKYAVQKQLQKRFSQYTSYQRDYNHLLLDALRRLLRETLQYEQVMGVAPGPDEPIRISVRHLEEKAREYDILDLQPFYDSAQFADDNFELHADVITHPR